jgi:hypothetical protein
MADTSEEKKEPDTPGEPGRPTKYKPEYDQEIYRLCLLGLPDKKLAEYLDISEDTLHEWKKVYPSFSESIREGRVKADGSVAHSLRERAEGYSWMEETPIKVKEIFYDEQGRRCERERIEITLVKKVVPPEPQAIRFWLMNRQKAYWRDKQEVEHSGEVSYKIRRAADTPQIAEPPALPEAPPSQDLPLGVVDEPEEGSDDLENT